MIRVRTWSICQYLFAGLALSLMGCGTGPQVRFGSPKVLIDQIYKRTECSRAVVGDARIEIDGPFAHYEGKLLFKVAAPNRLRFDLYNDFGVSLVAVASNEEQLSFFDLTSNTFFSGPPLACNLARFTQVSVSPFALVELLRGRPPIIEHKPNEMQLSWQSSWFGEGHYLIVVRDRHDSVESIHVRVPKADWSLPLSQQRVYLSKVRLEQGGQVSYAVDLDDYRAIHRASLEATAEEKEMGIFEHEASGPQCSAEVPHLISFDMGHAGHRLNIRARDVAHNPPLWPDSYLLQAPRGAKMTSGSCP